MPNQQKDYGSMEIEKLSKQGNDALRNEDYEKAFSCFSETLQLDPKNTDAFVFRGIARLGRGDLDGAIADWNKAIELDPNIAAAYANRGNAYQRKGELDDAMIDWSKAIQLDPQNAGVFYNRGLAYQEKQNWDKAISDYTEAIQLNPKYFQAYNNRGRIYGQKGEWDKALGDFTEAIRISPKNFNAYSSRGEVYQCIATCPEPSIKDGSKAVDLASRACELTQWKKRNYIGTLGAAYAETGDFAQAIIYESQAMAMEGVTEKIRVEAQQRLDLYKQMKPYRIAG